jgi:hypothetical protein
LRLSAFRFRHFRSFFPFVIAGLDPAIHAEVKHAKRLPPSVCLLEIGMDHRIKSGGDEFRESIWQSSGAQTHHENGMLFPSPHEAAGRVGDHRGGGSVNIASQCEPAWEVN